MSGTAIYRLQNVEKRHSETFALQLENLEIFRGELFALLGPTGAGKSTLLTMLAGLEQKVSGEVWLGDYRFDPPPILAAMQRRIAIVFQRPLLLRGTVRMNVNYPLVLQGRKDMAKVDRLLTRLGLDRLAQQAAATLSGGQTQLVALARALVTAPDVLLLDEPTANLDPSHVALAEQVIEEERQESGMTIVWATHNLFQARRVADRVALLLEGRLVEAAETEPFFEESSDPRTVDFIAGKMIY